MQTELRKAAYRMRVREDDEVIGAMGINKSPRESMFRAEVKQRKNSN
jgi:hypothetical protein